MDCPPHTHSRTSSKDEAAVSEQEREGSRPRTDSCSLCVWPPCLPVPWLRCVGINESFERTPTSFNSVSSDDACVMELRSD